MDVEECMVGRRSIRAFTPAPVDDDILATALRLANQAPSAGNLQARDFVVVKSLHTKKLLAEAALGQDFVRLAPVVLVCCANLERIGHYGDRGRSLYCLQDVAAAVENLLLYLHSRGLGATWVGAFDEQMVSKLLNLPAAARPVVIVPVGHPSGKGVRRTRLEPAAYVHWEKW